VWVRVLGSAAGGGFPQWNCNCPNCRGARDGSLPCRRRTQSSLVISADYERWFLLNASPDVGGQPDRTGAVVAAVAAGILQVSGRDEGLTRLGEDVPGR
jgi:pyrroloquinoline quinone biosynthesis protein B